MQKYCFFSNIKNFGEKKIQKNVYLYKNNIFMAIFEDENGNRTYYYYKKKIGRPKKRGPKKKPKKRGSEHQEPWNFKIIKCDFRKQDSVIGIFHNLDEVESAKQQLLKENEKIVFKKRNTVLHSDKKSSEYLSEYIVLQKIREENPESTIKLRNSYGKLVEHTTNSKKWRIYDKFPCEKEETFWMYGYNPKSDRKTFSWIDENYIEEPIMNDKFVIIRILVYNNKVIFRYDAENIEFVICKTPGDAIRFYNLLLKKYEKIKRVVFTGRIVTRSDVANTIINLIQEKTGWERRKITKMYS